MCVIPKPELSKQTHSYSNCSDPLQTSSKLWIIELHPNGVINVNVKNVHIECFVNNIIPLSDFVQECKCRLEDIKVFSALAALFLQCAFKCT